MKTETPYLTAIGMRVLSNHRVYYTIIQKDEEGTLIYADVSFINVPLTLNDPERLNFIRNTILDVMNEYDVTRAAIRVFEFGATFNQLLIERLNLEGVLQECLASCSVERFVAGASSTLSALANMPHANFKKLAAGEMDFEHYPREWSWSKLSLAERESVLTCYAAISL